MSVTEELLRQLFATSLSNMKQKWSVSPFSEPWHDTAAMLIQLKAAVFLCCHLDLSWIHAEGLALKSDEWNEPTYFHLPLTLPKWLAVSCCGGNSSAAKSSDEVFKLKTRVAVEKWFCLQYFLAVCVIWLCTIHSGGRERGKWEQRREKGKHKGDKDLARQ